jgi:AmmeMemoRadiSam system protein B
MLELAILLKTPINEFMKTIIRQAAVAGTFYPSEPVLLKNMLEHYLKLESETTQVPHAIIAPHAGYIYSGPIAASVYKRLQSAHSRIKRILLLGPSHRVGFKGLALSHADFFTTPLGDIPVDTHAVQQLANLPGIQYLDQAHTFEHSLEVHLPFLQIVLDDFTLIPVVVGDAHPEQIMQAIELFWGDEQTLTVISSDLSHFHDYETAQKMDQQTSQWIENLEYEKLSYESACGRLPISGILALARKKQLRVTTVDLRNSGDTAGSQDKHRVVGYGAYVIE